jgi:hypothetical protein
MRRPVGNEVAIPVTDPLSVLHSSSIENASWHQPSGCYRFQSKWRVELFRVVYTFSI